MAKPVLVPVGPDFSLSAASVDLNLKAHRVQLEENVPPSATVTDEGAYFAGGTAVTTDFTYTGIWFGSNFSDRMIGDDFGNLFFSGLGNDFLHGGAGDDSLSGGLGDDTINGGDGNDTISGSDGNDILNGGAGDDSISSSDDSGGHSSPGDDTVNGGAGNDTIRDGRGNGILNGGAGNDIIGGGEGNDTIYGGAGNDTIRGDGGRPLISNGTDIIHGGAGDDIIYGDEFLPSGRDNILFGDKGNDTIFGYLGNDTIDGGAGNDIIDGGDPVFGDSGSDTLTGGGGNDTFIFHDWVKDTITDFKHGQDKFDLRDTHATSFLQGVDFNSAQSALDYLDANEISAEGMVVKVIDGSAGALIGFSDDAGTIDLDVSVGARAAALITDSDFIF
ncbi:MAG: calcium-binding protein [Mesorhizobium sp.]|uniref:calcium-binding protein n=1 Tax=Mesorhizobium sp. TaxID=1871066 RepID=UPI000FE952B9|nr:calcium-binding protein [Mesorhizobium sp.]RWO94071.1 MAG: calcium-binding protein [Mesorhizobium sp.]